MDRAPAALDQLHALELRVLEGPQGGARAPLAVGVGCVLAAEPDGRGEGADIVLREEQVAPARVRVTADLAQARLEVLQGEVQLGEQRLPTGAQAAWPMHAPLKIGGSVVAFGQAGTTEWQPHAAPGESAGSPTGEGAASAPAAETKARPPLRRRAEVWLATTGALVLLACGGSLTMAHVAAAPQSTAARGAAPLAAALRGSEFAGLAASERADGRVELRGRLALLAERTRLDAWLAAQHFTPAIAVPVDEAIAQEVTEVFRINGVAVQARVAGPGAILAEAADRDADRLARAEGVVRRDVRHLDKLSVHNSAKPLPPPAPPVPDDPNKRIASLVPGDPAYVVTVDGARYFVGALLPSGHRITQVAAERVTLERDGQQSSLNF